jgi:hypothetical protein
LTTITATAQLRAPPASKYLVDLHSMFQVSLFSFPVEDDEDDARERAASSAQAAPVLAYDEGDARDAYRQWENANGLTRAHVRAREAPCVTCVTSVTTRTSISDA